MSTGKGGSCPLGGRGVFLPNSIVLGELEGLRVSGWPQSSVTFPCKVSEPQAFPLDRELERQHMQSAGPSGSLLTRSWSQGPLTPSTSVEMGPPKHCQRGHCLGYKLGSFNPLFSFAMTSKSVHSIVLHPIIFSLTQ